MKKPRGTQLTFKPISDPALIPPYLVEQMKGREFEVEQFYKVVPLMMRSPFVIFGAFVNMEKEIKGFLLGDVNPLDMWLHIAMLSIDKQYYRKGIIPETLGILKHVVKNNELKGIVMVTTRPKAFEIAGFERSKLTRMRYIYG